MIVKNFRNFGYKSSEFLIIFFNYSIHENTKTKITFDGIKIGGFFTTSNNELKILNNFFNNSFVQNSKIENSTLAKCKHYIDTKVTFNSLMLSTIQQIECLLIWT